MVRPKRQRGIHPPGQRQLRLWLAEGGTLLHVYVLRGLGKIYGCTVAGGEAGPL